MKAGKSAAPQPSDHSCVAVPWLWNLGAVEKTHLLSHLQGCSILCRPQLSPGWQEQQGGRCWGSSVAAWGWEPPSLQPRLLCPPWGHLMNGCSPCPEPSRSAPVHMHTSRLGSGLV